MKLAFDIDGTLLDHVGEVNYSDPRSVKAGCIQDRRAAHRVRYLIEQGHELHVISGRGKILRRVTLDQMRQIHPDLAKPSRVHLQDHFTDYGAMRYWKRDVLRNVEAELYVGDHPIDELAAEDAGVPFLHADPFRSGAALPGVLA